MIVLCSKIMKYLNIKYRLLVYFTSITFCSGDIKKEKSSKNEKKALKMTNQLVIFRDFFSSFFSSPDPKTEKIS